MLWRFLSLETLEALLAESVYLTVRAWDWLLAGRCPAWDALMNFDPWGDD